MIEGCECKSDFQGYDAFVFDTDQGRFTFRMVFLKHSWCSPASIKVGWW